MTQLHWTIICLFISLITYTPSSAPLAEELTSQEHITDKPTNLSPDTLADTSDDDAINHSLTNASSNDKYNDEYDDNEDDFSSVDESNYSAFTVLDAPQHYVSSGVAQLSKSIDEFFSNEKTMYERSGSFIRINGDAIFNKNEETGFAGNVRIKIVLPNTQKKLKLVIESDPNETREDIDQQQQPTPLEAAQEKTYFAGLESTGKEVGKWKFRPGIGLKLNAGPDLLLRYRASRNYIINDYWRAYLSETVYWYDSEGYRFNSTLELNRKIYDNFLFRASTFAGWKEETEYWDLSQRISLTQTLSNKSQIVYQAGVFGISEPEILTTTYVYEIRYRKRIHSDYLFAELIPRVLYERETNFKSALSLTFRLEIVFKE